RRSRRGGEDRPRASRRGAVLPRARRRGEARGVSTTIVLLLVTAFSIYHILMQSLLVIVSLWRWPCTIRPASEFNCRSSNPLPPQPQAPPRPTVREWSSTCHPVVPRQNPHNADWTTSQASCSP